MIDVMQHFEESKRSRDTKSDVLRPPVKVDHD